MPGWLVAVIAAAAFLTGAQVTHWKHNSDALHAEQTRQHAETLARELIQEVAMHTATAIGGIRVENRTIYQTARTEVVREPVYSQCLVPVAGSRLLNEARGHGGDRPKPDAALPADPAGDGQARRTD